MTNAKAFLEIVSDHPTMKPIPFLEGMWQVAAAHWRKFYLQNIPFFFFLLVRENFAVFDFSILEFVSNGHREGGKGGISQYMVQSEMVPPTTVVGPLKLKKKKTKLRKVIIETLSELLSSTNRYTH